MIAQLASTSPLVYGKNAEFEQMRNLARSNEVMKAIGFTDGFEMLNSAVKNMAAQSIGTTVEEVMELSRLEAAEKIGKPAPKSPKLSAEEKQKAKEEAKKSKENSRKADKAKKKSHANSEKIAKAAAKEKNIPYLKVTVPNLWDGQGPEELVPTVLSDEWQRKVSVHIGEVERTRLTFDRFSKA